MRVVTTQIYMAANQVPGRHKVGLGLEHKTCVSWPVVALVVTTGVTLTVQECVEVKQQCKPLSLVPLRCAFSKHEPFAAHL